MKLFIKLALLLLPTFAHANTDWTPLLNDLKNGCRVSTLKDYGFELTEPYSYFESNLLPHHLQNSIDKNIRSERGFNLELKNAYAFNSELYQIYGNIFWGDVYVKLHFNDDNFMKSLPQFYYYNNGAVGKIFATPYVIEREINDGLGSNYQTHPHGYSVYDAGMEVQLEFNPRNKTITCKRHFHRE